MGERKLKPPRGKTYRHNAIYAVYKGENLIAEGTQDECAEKLNILPQSIYKLATPGYKKSIENSETSRVAEIIDWE